MAQRVPSDSSSVTTPSDFEDESNEEEHAAADGSEAEAFAPLAHQPKTPIIAYTPGRSCPVLVFQPVSTLDTFVNDEIPVGEFAFAFKVVKNAPDLIKAVLGQHGFREAHPSSLEFNIMWANSHLKPYHLQGLLPHQKVNHFPRSSELTRKDRLAVNVHRMQQLKGFRAFNIAPQTFLLPAEFSDFQAEWAKDKAQRWIVKPVASSQGRGIYLVNHPNQVALDEPLVVSRYISNPLLVDGFKFDLRLYVAVTSYDPLRIYLYEEGLARFATSKFDTSGRNIKDSFMHLTNYSINKKSAKYVSCSDDSVEDFGNKWSFGALLQHLAGCGNDTVTLVARIESLVVKTIISGELPIVTACRAHVTQPDACFELYGFDILIDADLVPWLVEVNLSPSMACESPLDMKIKGHLIADFFTLGLIPAVDPIKARQEAHTRGNPLAAALPRRPSSAGRPGTGASSRPRSAGGAPTQLSPARPRSATGAEPSETTPQQRAMLRRAADEQECCRRTGFMRIFPADQTWELYGSYLEDRSKSNKLLHETLYPGCRMNRAARGSSARSSPTMGLASTSIPNAPPVTDELLRRMKRFERSLFKRSAPVQEASPSRSIAPIAAIGRPSPAEVIASVAAAARVVQRPTARAQSAPLSRNLERQEPALQASAHGAAASSGPDPAPYGSSAPRPSAAILRASPASARPPDQRGLQEMVADGDFLSSVQARQAFTAYLTRVKDRLFAECRDAGAEDTPVDPAAAAVDSEQMEVILRFLRRAAANFSERHAFKVITPSQRLRMSDRKRIMVTQLTDFIRAYTRATEALPAAAGEEAGMPAADFARFATSASEEQLEAMLSRYNQSHASTTIFLGDKTDDGVPQSRTTDRSNVAARKAPASGRAQSASAAARPPRPGGSVRSPYAASPSQPQRPFSASASAVTRPVSAARTAMAPAQRPLGFGAEEPEPTADHEAIQQALDRIRSRQASRMYQATAAGMLHKQ